jgi:hypothetical protein
MLFSPGSQGFWTIFGFLLLCLGYIRNSTIIIRNLGASGPSGAGPGYPLVSFLPPAKKDTASIPCACQNPVVRGALLRLKPSHLYGVQRPFSGAGRVRQLLG